MGSFFVALLWLPALLVASADHAEEACATHLVQRKAQPRFAEATSAKTKLGDRKPWDVFDFVGAVQHKSGVSLLHKIWFYLFQGVLGAQDDNMGVIMTPCYEKCRNTEAPIRWIVDTTSPELVEYQRARAKEKGKGLRVAGLIRDPVSMAVSEWSGTLQCGLSASRMARSFPPKHVTRRGHRLCGRANAPIRG